MQLTTALFGEPLRSDEEPDHRIGTLRGIPVLGLDALASASYGPEAALTMLIAAGPAAPRQLVPVMACIVVLLIIVYLSYRQTVAAYPDGGGAFTVARENLGANAALVAAAALALDYILNTAVAISAGVGALVSAVPPLSSWTLSLCLALLLLLTVVNLRGIRSAGLVFLTPTYLFIALLGVTLIVGIVKTWLASGHPEPVQALPPPVRDGAARVGIWLLLRSFGNGCTAMTGIEAVSNAVPLFREHRVVHARRTLTAIVATLIALLCGLTVLVRAYDITATEPDMAGYQSVVSQVVTAVAGRGVFYYATMTAVIMVLALSANTSFADFPRVGRVLAADGYLPAVFGRRGRRLVFTGGILVLAALSGALLIVFGGVTEHLIPLFAVGALLAFTMSQLGMVAHWRASQAPGRRVKLSVNAIGAAATSIALLIVLVSKFLDGAWITALLIPALFLLFRRTRQAQDRLTDLTRAEGPLELGGLTRPSVVIPLRRMDRLGRRALRFALTISADVHVVQVLAEDFDVDDLRGRWRELVEEPIRRAGDAPLPSLVVLQSPYREFHARLLQWLRAFRARQPDRDLIVLIPELVERRWYRVVFSGRAVRLRSALLTSGDPHICVMSTPWYPDRH